MDDGSAIALSITIDPETGSAVFDFEGTSPEARGNWNAPISVVHSAIIYWWVFSPFSIILVVEWVSGCADECTWCCGG